MATADDGAVRGQRARLTVCQSGAPAIPHGASRVLRQARGVTLGLQSLRFLGEGQLHGCDMMLH